MDENEDSVSIVFPKGDSTHKIDENSEILETVGLVRLGFDVGTLPPGAITTKMIEAVITKRTS